MEADDPRVEVEFDDGVAEERAADDAVRSRDDRLDTRDDPGGVPDLEISDARGDPTRQRDATLLAVAGAADARLPDDVEAILAGGRRISEDDDRRAGVEDQLEGRRAVDRDGDDDQSVHHA